MTRSTINSLILFIGVCAAWSLLASEQPAGATDAAPVSLVILYPGGPAPDSGEARKEAGRADQNFS